MQMGPPCPQHHRTTTMNTTIPPAFRRPVRLSVTIPHAIFCHLEREATLQGRSMSNLAAHLIERGLKQAPPA